MSLKPGALIDGRYVIEALIGRGGMSVVYRVRHRELQTVHALKVLHGELAGLAGRLVTEGRAQGGLRHPNVLTVTDMVSVEGSPALILELVEGPDLHALLSFRSLHVDEVDVLGRQLIDAVVAAHSHGLVHRDLKPGNVLLATHNGVPSVKVADFGLVKVPDKSPESPDRTRTGSSMGTPGYMAPEQIEDASAADGRADLFAVGAILYEMLTGARAFAGDSVFDTLRATHDGDFTPVGERAPHAPRRMITAIEAALQVDREWRVGSAAALRELWVDDQPAPWVAWGTLPEITCEQAPPSEEASAARSFNAQVAREFREQDPHPDMAALVDRVDDPVVQQHLARCARCRVERRLYLDAFRTERVAAAMTSGGWWGLGSTVAAVPLTIGLLSVLFGGLEDVEMMGPFGIAMALVTVCTAGWTVRVVVRAWQGATPGPFSWFGGPVVIGLLGLVGSAMGNRMVKYTATQIAPDERGFIATRGVWVALSTEYAAYAMIGVLLLSITEAASAVVRVRSEQWKLDLGAPLAAIAVIGGSLLWATDAVLRSEAPAPFAVFLTVLAVGASAVAADASSDRHDPGRVSARRIVAPAGIGATVAVALAVHTGHQRSLFKQLEDEAPADALAAADYAASVLSVDAGAMVAALAALLVWLPALLSADRRGSWPSWRWASSLALLLLMLGGGWRYARAWQDQAAREIVPAHLAQAAAWFFPGQTLESAMPDSEVRLSEARHPLADGDVVVAVNSRPVGSVGELLRGLQACVCGAVGACSIANECLDDGAKLALTVQRTGEDGRRLVNVTVQLWGPRASSDSAATPR